MSSKLWHFHTTSVSFLPITQLSLCTAGLTVIHKLVRLLFCLVLHPEGEITLQFFPHNIPALLLWEYNKPSCHSILFKPGLCVFLYVLFYLFTTIYVHFTFLYALKWMFKCSLFCQIMCQSVINNYCSVFALGVEFIV